MATKFDAFAAALADLCRQHHVAIAPTRGGIDVFDIDEDGAPVRGLNDRTEHAGDVDATDEADAGSLPSSFLTALAAEQFPGYVGRELSRPLAEALAEKHPGADIVPIGSGRYIRGRAVIQQ